MPATAFIRLAAPGDAEEIARMSRRYVEQGLSWDWRPQRVRLMILDADTLVVVAGEGVRSPLTGFAILQCGTISAHLNLLAVKPRFRRRGIAGQLLRWLEASCGVAGIGHIALEVRQNNQGAISFYRTMGYRITGRKRGYYQGREDALTLSRRLIPIKLEAQRP